MCQEVSTLFLEEPHKATCREGTATPKSLGWEHRHSESLTHSYVYTHTTLSHMFSHSTHTQIHTHTHTAQPCFVLRVCQSPWWWALSHPSHSRGWCVHTPFLDTSFSLRLWPQLSAPQQTLPSKEAVQASVSKASPGGHMAWDSLHSAQPSP